MPAAHGDQQGASVRRAWLLAVTLVFLAVHVGLGVLDVRHPEVFLRADRAVERMHRIQELLGTHDWALASDYLASHGNFGDYAVHAVLYLLGGRAGVILAQVLLWLVSGAGVLGIAQLLGLSARGQIAALAIYFALPHSLVLPHELATEGLEVPLMVLSTWLFCRSMEREELRSLIAGALLLALATLIRPITLLWPVVLFGVAAVWGRTRSAAAFGAVAYVPVLLWMCFVWAHTGAFGLGESEHSLGHNLYLRVVEVARTMAPPDAQKITAEHLHASQRLGVGEYLDVALHHPAPFAAAAARDGLVFWGKSGVERLTLDYLGSDAQFKALTSVDRGWRAILDTATPLAALRYAWQVTGPVLLVSLVASLMLVFMVVLALIGAVGWLRAARVGSDDVAAEIAVRLLMILPLYVFAFSLVVMTVRSGHRAPVEFALVLLAVCGWQRLRARAPRSLPSVSG